MQEIIKTVMEFILGIALLPIAGSFVVYVQADENLSGIMGFAILMSLGVVILALGIIYHSAKELFF